MPPQRVLVLYNEPVLPRSHPDHESERANLDVVEWVHDALTASGQFEVSRLGVRDDLAALVHDLAERRPAAVFNLFEGLPDRSETESVVAGILEWLGVPFTGSSSCALTMAHNKVLTKRLLRGAGLPTPDFLVVDALPPPKCPLEWPVIIKPAEQDASVGLDQGSVTTNQQEYEERARSLLKRFGPPVLVERYVPGREFNVAMIESPTPRALPFSEILFLEDHERRWPIVTYEAKWNYESRACVLTPPRCPADVEPGLAAHLESLAVNAFRIVGCRDYARFDFRVTEAGEPYLLDVNPNPDFGPQAGFANSLRAAGIDHAGFAVELVQRALARSCPMANEQ